MLSNISNPINQLAVLCGLAFIPHSVAKFTSRDAVFGFFDAAGLRPAAFFVYLALVIEILATVGLVFDVLLPYAAALAAVFMLGAAAAVLKVSGGRWVWNLGGCEFHVFWATCCIIIAIHTWPRTSM